MDLKRTAFDGLFEIEPRILLDERGYFFESYQKQKLADQGLDVNFVQDNQSYSVGNVIRGLHFQKAPFAQGKLVRAISGQALDVVVDLRKGQPTFGKHYSCLLDSKKGNMLYIPEGFAHGFAALEPTVFFYKCTNYYHKASESGIIWNDPELGIDWGINQPEVSDKDQKLLPFAEVISELD
jgi:dTDP-4-dehydrorhamnose 3,5-epimerase